MTAPVTNFETTTGQTARSAGRKAAPAVATSTVLILARLWNANGAEHSTGAAVLMGTLALGTAVAGTIVTQGTHGDPTSSALTFTAAGTLAFAGVAAYSDELPLPLLLWGVATVLAYVAGFRVWREDRRSEEAHGRSMETRREDHRHREAVATIQARAQVDTRYVDLEIARESTEQASALADAITARNALPGFNPAAFPAITGQPQLSVVTETEASK